jgi:hypothetical protein
MISARLPTRDRQPGYFEKPLTELYVDPGMRSISPATRLVTGVICNFLQPRGKGAIGRLAAPEAEREEGVVPTVQ